MVRENTCGSEYTPIHLDYRAFDNESNPPTNNPDHASAEFNFRYFESTPGTTIGQFFWIQSDSITSYS